MQNIKAIVFDIDDTLVQTIKCKWLALKATAKKYYNLEVTDKKIKKFWGTPFPVMLSGIFSNIDDVETIKKHYIETSKQFPMVAHPETVEVVDKLKESYHLAALTSSSRHVILKDLKDSGFNIKDFYFIQTVEDTPYHKPNPKVFKPVLTKLRKLHILYANIVYVGDSLRDFEASQKTGINFIAITSGLTKQEEFEKAGVPKKYILKDLTNLIQILNE